MDEFYERLNKVSTQYINFVICLDTLSTVGLATCFALFIMGMIWPLAGSAIGVILLWMLRKSVMPMFGLRILRRTIRTHEQYEAYVRLRETDTFLQRMPYVLPADLELSD